MLQYRYHERKEKSPCRLVFLADYLSYVNWNLADPPAGHLDNSIYKPREFVEVRGIIHRVISHPGYV